MCAHRFRWLAGMLAAVIGLLLWQNLMLRVELRRLNNHVEEAVATAEDASKYARRALDAADRQPNGAPIPASDHPIHYRAIPLPGPRGEGGVDWEGRPLADRPNVRPTIAGPQR